MQTGKPITGAALVVFSGGQDSTTCLYWAKEQFARVHAVTFSYGQRHSIELESAAQIARMAGVSHEVIDIGNVLRDTSTLTCSDGEVPSAAAESENKNSLPSTFVPGRNIIFLSLAGSRAYTLGCDKIVCGVSQEDFSGYPDCREEFIRNMEKALIAGLERSIQIVCPLMSLTKCETVRLAMTLPGCMEGLGYSTTCYNGSVPPCHHCNSCLLRAKGFSQAGVVDPLLERLSSRSAEGARQ